jgi:hypothetical protein
MRTLFIVLACLTSLGLNCQNTDKALGKDVMSGSYLAVTKTQDSMNGLKEKFAPYGVKEFKFIGKNILSIKLGRDPGLEKMKKITSTCSNISSIEPNRVIKVKQATTAGKI